VIKKAIEKINSEMEKDKDPYVQVIGNFLLDYINKNPDSSEKILSENKTIAKSIDEMASVAKKKAVKGRAMLTDQEGFQIVLKYFGVNEDIPVTIPIAKEAGTPIITLEKKKTVIDFDVKLEDFM
jgi:hypothetical protein